MGVKQTGLLDDRVMSLVMRGNCLRKKERLRVKSAGGTGGVIPDEIQTSWVYNLTNSMGVCV